MKDTEYNFSTSGEYSAPSGDEFNMDPVKMPAQKTLEEAPEKNSQRLKAMSRQAAAKAAAVLLSVVLVTDSFGMDILGGSGPRENVVLELTAEQYAFLSTIFRMCMDRVGGEIVYSIRLATLASHAVEGLEEVDWFDGTNAYSYYARTKGVPGFRFNYLYNEDVWRGGSAIEFYYDGVQEPDTDYLSIWASPYDYGDGFSCTSQIFSIKKVDEDRRRITEAEGSCLSYSKGGELVVRKGSFSEHVVNGSAEIFLDDGTISLEYDILPGTDVTTVLNVTGSYLRGENLSLQDDGIFIHSNSNREYFNYLSNINFPEDPFYCTSIQGTGIFYSADDSDDGNEPAEGDGQDSEPADDAVEIELTEAQKSFLDQLYDACISEDQSQVRNTMQGRSVSFADYLYYDGEKAWDRMSEGTRTLYVEPYGKPDPDDPSASLDGLQADLYFSGSVAEGSKVLEAYNWVYTADSGTDISFHFAIVTVTEVGEDGVPSAIRGYNDESFFDADGGNIQLQERMYYEGLFVKDKLPDLNWNSWLLNDGVFRFISPSDDMDRSLNVENGYLVPGSDIRLDDYGGELAVTIPVYFNGQDITSIGMKANYPDDPYYHTEWQNINSLHILFRDEN